MRKACSGNTGQAFLLSLNFFEHIFGSAAHRADPVLGEFAKRGVWRDIPVGIALFWIIDVTTDFTLPLFHRCAPLRTIDILQIPPSPFAKGGGKGEITILSF